MKILLVGINAKYIHSNLAVYSLRASAMKYFADVENVKIEIAEYTINQTVEKIIQGIYKERPDMIGISCYIWNVMMVHKIVAELPKLLCHVPIWLGGPEVSFDLEWQLQRFPAAAGIMYGEGERTFPKLIEAYEKRSFDIAAGASYDGDHGKSINEELKDIKGIIYRDPEDNMIINAPAEIMDLDELPFPYNNIEDFQYRIIYYETSRGCPYSCAYCLSSVEKELRYRSLDKVYAELQTFLDAKVKQVKFVDRTFNCDHSHATAILHYIKEHDNGVTNFHFEVAGDLLTEEEMMLIGSLRPGLIQLEIGVQSTNEKTLKAIRRRTDLELLKNNVRKLLKNGNVHLHLDLIAGLPFENMDSFIHSFNEVYQIGGHELQLGFLKLLRGTPMMQMKEEHGIVCTDFPPYEMLCTKELSYEEVLRLKAVEEMLEIYHNSGQFRLTEQFLLSMFASPFDFYERLAKFYEENNYPVICSARERRYVILLEFVTEYMKTISYRDHSQRLECDHGDMNKYKEEKKENGNKILETVRELLTVDYYLRERAKARPSFAREENMQYRKIQELDLEIVMNRKAGFREWLRSVYQQYAESQNCDARQLEGQMHLEILHYADVIPNVSLPQIILFDYRKRDPVTKEASISAWGIKGCIHQNKSRA